MIPSFWTANWIHGGSSQTPHHKGMEVGGLGIASPFVFYMLLCLLCSQHSWAVAFGFMVKVRYWKFLLSTWAAKHRGEFKSQRTAATPGSFSESNSRLKLFKNFITNVESVARQWKQNADGCGYWQLDVTPWNFLKTNQWMSICSHSLLNISMSWNIKMLNDWALNLNDGEEGCFQGTCPESERKDCHRPLNQNRSLEVIKGKKRPWKKSRWPERSLILSNCKMLTCCNHFKYHWCSGNDSQEGGMHIWVCVAL